ncbi:MAG TPA: hypothetical protein VHO03_17240 [Ignavibacteriales bacterium]|nr:hypothetical protein [Ignavibacteriales bacterium]
MVVDNEFDFGQTVYLKTDQDQLPRMVTLIQVGPSGHLLYYLSCGPTSTWHYEMEISAERVWGNEANVDKRKNN